MTDAEWIAGAAGAAAALVVAAVAVWLRRRRVSLLGPVFWYEVVTLARRGQQPRLRALLAGLLLVFLFVAYLKQFSGRELAALTDGVPLSQGQTSAFAYAFLVAFLCAQLAVVVLLTPAIVGGSLTEEKQRGTLDFLRGSLLTGREIILGKLAARLAFVFGVLLAGVPVLALTMLFGGVDPSLLFAGYVVAVLAALALGAYSLLVAVSRESLREVLVHVYAVVGALAILGSCCSCVPGVAAVSPVSALGYLFLHETGSLPSEPLFWIHLGVYSAVHLVVLVVCAARAVVLIRVAPERPLSAPVKSPYVFADDEPVHTPTGRVVRLWEVPRLRDDDPLLWKEVYFSGKAPEPGGFSAGCGVAAIAGVGFLVGLVLFFAMIAELNRGNWVGEALNPPARLFVVAGTLFVGVAVGVRAAGSVARERERQTLDGLLALPVARGDILWAKWAAQFRWARGWLLAIAAAGCGSLVLGGVHPFGFGFAVAQSAGWVVLCASLGLWLSVRCATVTRATVFFLIGVMALVAGPLVAAPVAEAASRGAGEWVREFSLPVGLWEALPSWGDYARDRGSLGGGGLVGQAGGVAGAGYGLAAAALRVLAWRAFGRGERGA